jgi:DNA-binding GntR family transcriptional regulator
MSLEWKTKRDFVVDSLRQAIMNGEFAPGGHLSLEALANRFGVSQTPIREALRELQFDGLVESEPHKGVWVRDHSIENAYQVFSIRAILEAFAARLAMANIQESDLGQLRGYTDDMIDAMHKSDADAVRVANQAIHFHIYRLTGWPKLESMMQGLWLQSPWSMLRLVPGRTAQSVVEHEQILQSMIDGDAERVEELLSDHVISARDALVAQMSHQVALY